MRRAGCSSARPPTREPPAIWTLEGVALHRFGDRLFNVGRYEQSLELLTRAAAAFEAAKAPVDLGTVYNSIGRVYRAHGRLDEALKYQKAALELHRKGGDRFALLQSLNAVAVVYQRLDDLDRGASLSGGGARRCRVAAGHARRVARRRISCAPTWPRCCSTLASSRRLPPRSNR